MSVEINTVSVPDEKASAVFSQLFLPVLHAANQVYPDHHF